MKLKYLLINLRNIKSIETITFYKFKGKIQQQRPHPNRNARVKSVKHQMVQFRPFHLRLCERYKQNSRNNFVRNFIKSSLLEEEARVYYYYSCGGVSRS